MFLEIALPNFSKKPLTYSYHDKSILGYRVKVPFGKQYKIGIVIGESTKTELKMDIKPIEKHLDQIPILTAEHLLFLRHLANYYHISINDLILSTLPKDALKENCIIDPLWFKKGSKVMSWHDLLQQHHLPTLHKKVQSGEWKTAEQPETKLPPSSLSALNHEQQTVLNHLKKINLLWGKTGSGKTEIYTHLIHKTLEKSQQVLFLVPEIALTQQIANKVEKRLGFTPTMVHSLLSPKQKLCRWLKIFHGQAHIILGTRSALLYPIKDLGLIIVDEEHDNAYRQEQSLFFSARDAAVLKASQLDIPIILGSATPSLESYYNALQKKYHLCILNNRYNATPPKIHLLERPKDTFIAPKLIDIVKRELDTNHHVMLYIGKRGYSRLLKCHHCGYELRCPSCDRLLIYHENHQNKCHHCDLTFPVEIDCTSCQTTELSHYGAGSQRISEIAKTLWPHYPVLRIDTDNLNSKEASQALSNLNTASATLIVGTQMITKGHDIEQLNTVVVVDPDHSLYAPDFRAEEKLFAELIQVSGRSGRRDKQGHVYIQTQSMDHIVFKSLNSPSTFYQYLLEKRQRFSLPPYTYMACIFIRLRASQVKKLTSIRLPSFEKVEVLGPCLFQPGQRGSQLCYQLMITSIHRSRRNHACSYLYQLLEQKLSRNTSLLVQMDSHLSL